MAEPKAHRVERSRARTYLGKADEFLAAAKTALAAEQNDAALLLAIHAGISACDAVTVALGGLRSTDPDHLRTADDESSILNAHLDLALHCTEAVAVERGVLIPTENRFHDVVRAAAGEEWSGVQRAAYGLDGGDAVARARATRELYARTAALLDSDLAADDRAVIDRVLQIPFN